MRIRCLLTAAALAPAVLPGALGPRYGGELTVGVRDLPASLAPAVPAEAESRLLFGMAHETLVGLTPNGFPTPSLARSWEAAAGGRELTLTLRDGTRFHDDSPMGPTDAVRSLRRFLRAPSPAGARLAGDLEGGSTFRSGATDDLPGLRALEGRRLSLRLVADRIRPLAPLASPAAAVTGPAGAGCGPFVPTMALPGRRIVFTAFSGHVRGRPYLDQLQVAVASNPPADVTAGPGGVSSLAATLLLVLDPRRPAFREAKARAALAAAFDRLSIAGLVPGAEPLFSLLPPALLTPLGPAEAAAMGPRAGSLTLAVSMDVPPLLSRRVVAHLAALGSTVRVLPAAPATVSAVPADARLLLWSPEVPEAALAIEELAAMAPKDDGLRALLDEAAAEVDDDRRRRTLYRAEESLRSSRVLVPLAAIPVAFTTRAGVHGLRVDLSGRLVLEDAWVEP